MQTTYISIGKLSLFSLIFIFFSTILFAQKIGFVSSDVIRSHFTESKQADQRVQSLVEEWKRELEALQKEIESLDFEIKKNRLVWSDVERLDKEKQLDEKKTQRLALAKSKFEAGGEYDHSVKSIMQPVEDKIYAAIQQIASDEGVDLIFDQSIQPMPYMNFKYDMTVKVLRKLGVNTDELEKELQDKIDKDPRNQKKESIQPRKKSRTRQPSSTDRDIQREGDENIDSPGDESQGSGTQNKKPPNLPGNSSPSRPPTPDHPIPKK